MAICRWGNFLPTFILLLLINLQINWACETLPSTIHIIKEIETPNGDVERTCEGEVAVSKCEGSCASKVRPSAMSHSGFAKDCQCCRETQLRSREITLTRCYDRDGRSLTGDKETYAITLKEPTDCRCFRCGDTNAMH